MKQILVLCALALLASGCRASESDFAKLCEAELKSRVARPDTYERIDLTEFKEPADLGEMFASEPAVLRFYKSENMKAVTHVALFKYATKDLYGATAQRSSRCTSDALDGKPPTTVRQLLKIDGKTSIDILVDAVRTKRYP